VSTEMLKFHVGDRVEKYTGAYHFHGIVRAAYHTGAGKARYVIEPDAIPMQLIYSAEQLRIANREGIEIT
jgi:hypothetical protein